MIDCPNVETRESLPDYLNGTLPARRHAEVEAHLASCAECRAELETIRLVREAWHGVTVRIDVPSLVSALPRPRPVRVASRRSWVRSHAYQIAAAVSFVALGGMSLAVARSFFMDAAVTADSSQVATGDSGAVAGGLLPEISFAGGVSDLGDEDLESLLTAIESIEALPVAEPATMVLGVGERQGT